MCVCDEMTVHVSVPGPGLPSPRPSCPGCCLHPCCPHPSGSVPRPLWAGVTGRSPSPLWVTHWEAGRRGSCLLQPRTHPFCPESLAPRGQAGWAGLGWAARSQALVALHVGHPSEALQVSRGQHPHLPILASEGSPGGGARVDEEVSSEPGPKRQELHPCLWTGVNPKACRSGGKMCYLLCVVVVFGVHQSRRENK